MRVKICGMTRTSDARTAESAGASWVGAVMVPSSPRHVEPAEARRIAESVEIPLVVVVADRSAEETAELARAAGARGIQLHGDEPPRLLDRLRELGDWELWKAVRVRSDDDILRAAERFGARADALLLDGWDARKLGGTGRVFPWDALERVRDGLPEGLRIGAAGGLDAGNVSEAVSRLTPDFVDVSSGVESSPGMKDPARIRAFMAAALAAGERVG